MAGFARTLAHAEGLGDPASRYAAMIEEAAGQIRELLDELTLVSRIETGRYEPPLAEADTAELARTAAERLGPDRVSVSGAGGNVRVDVEAIERAVSSLARCALRHGGLERVELVAHGEALSLSPITTSSAPVVLGTQLRDLGAAVAVRVIEALGGSVALDAETLRIRLPAY